MELNIFIGKFKVLWNARLDAHLAVETQDGQVWFGRWSWPPARTSPGPLRKQLVILLMKLLTIMLKKITETTATSGEQSFVAEEAMGFKVTAVEKEGSDTDEEALKGNTTGAPNEEGFDTAEAVLRDFNFEISDSKF